MSDRRAPPERPRETLGLSPTLSPPDRAQAHHLRPQLALFLARLNDVPRTVINSATGISERQIQRYRSGEVRPRCAQVLKLTSRLAPGLGTRGSTTDVKLRGKQ